MNTSQIKEHAQDINNAISGSTQKYKLMIARLVDLIKQPSLYDLLGQHEKDTISKAEAMLKVKEK